MTEPIAITLAKQSIKAYETWLADHSTKIQLLSNCDNWSTIHPTHFPEIFERQTFFRIRPEAVRDNYRPFTIEEGRLLVGKAVVDKASKNRRLIVDATDLGPEMGRTYSCSWGALLNLYEFDDGKPCGVEVGE